MSILLPSYLALVNFDHLGAFMIPIAGIILAGVITVTSMYFKHQRERQWHETARIALEKGQPVPPMPDDGPHGSGRVLQRKAGDTTDYSQHDVRGGLVLIATGVGLWLMLGALDDRLRFIGAIPGFIGVALLLYAALRALFTRKSAPRDDLTPRT